MFENMLRVKDICKKYGVGRYTVDKAVRSGRLAAYRPNCRDFRFRESDVERWIGDTRVAAPLRLRTTAQAGLPL